MRVGELASRTGVSVRSIRYYEAAGLVAAVRRPNGYREFGPEAVARVQAVRDLIASGFLVDELVPLADCLDQGCATARCRRETAQLYRDKLVRVETQLRTLEELRGRLRARLATLKES